MSETTPQEPVSPSADQPVSPPAPAPGPVPYERFAEVNRERKEMAERLAKLEDQAKKAEEARLAEQNEWKTLAENREKDAATLKAELQETTLIVLRLQAAVKHNIPAHHANRLVGTTAEEIEADAIKLAADMKPTTPGTPPPGPRTPPQVAPTPEQLRDPKWVRENRDKVLNGR